MEIRQYLDILRRQKWLVIEAVVIVAVVAGVLSNMRTPVYATSARVLLRPNDPAEQLYPGYSLPVVPNDQPDRLVAAHVDLVQSPDVARAAAAQVPGARGTELLGEVSASQVGESDMIDITASGIDPERARVVANAFARAYIENRRQYAVAGLQKAVDDIDRRLEVLQRKIATLDARIVDDRELSGAEEASAGLQQPTGPAIPGPTGAGLDGPTGTGLDPGDVPTDNEALKAARYAAATQFENLFVRHDELLVEISLKRGEAELVAAATTPTDPVSPRPKRDAALGAFLGLLLGLGVAFLREQIDDRVRLRDEIEQALELPVLAELPIDAGTLRNPERLASAEHPHGALAEAVRSLRTSLAFLAVEQPLRTIVVTSTGPDEGKTVVAANLATVYAQAGYRTVVVSSDLRRPRLDELLGASRTPGRGLTTLVTELAAGASDEEARAAVERALAPTAVPGLRLLPAGPEPPNPAELLGSRRMTQVLDLLSGLADVVILDTPPLLAVTDAAVLGAKADGVVLVASIGESHRGALHRVRAAFADAPARLLGVAVNKVPATRGYSYGYRRYHGYYEEPGTRRGIFRRRRSSARGTLDVPTLEPDLPGHAVTATNGAKAPASAPEGAER